MKSSVNFRGGAFSAEEAFQHVRGHFSPALLEIRAKTRFRARRNVAFLGIKYARLPQTPGPQKVFIQVISL